MDGDATPSARDVRPLAVTGIVLGAAVLLNAYTHNRLWFSYSLVGVGVFFVFLALWRQFHWQIPPQALWGVGLTAALHFLGGSLSGLHQIGGANGLYYAFPWWDNVVHVLGCGAVAMAAYAVLAARLAKAGPVLLAFNAIAIAALAGVLVELYEFAQYVFFGTVDQGYYSNNMLDLYYDLLGGAFGAIAYARTDRAMRRGAPAEPERGPT